MQLSKIIPARLGVPAWTKPNPRPSASLVDYPIRTSEKLRFADTDRNGHISNTAFAVCCQNARMEILYDRNRVPLSFDAQFVIVRFELQFHREMHWPGTVEIGTRLERIGRCSVTMGQCLFQNGRHVASATSTVVLIDPSTRRTTPLPDETATALRALANTTPARGTDGDPGRI
ncbi:thioesterase family protein [Hyphomicrobium sp.]|uniref:acyl-CoA thioesterase n=1 Tax=Hyphomicrobium sp. TaxID=82 RepID=UPI0025BD888E|nr:thioesterase family protein [Hyphomicrobium sp.]MCC7253574.1 acyl-CoA thioesterase [Hyphomicrobium sp.]